MRYQFEGLAPETGPDGTLVRPLDVREFDEAPGWGIWERLHAAEDFAAVLPPPPEPEPAADPATGTEG